jgi:hypothetical protein
MGMEINGRLHVINEAQQVTERFRKREFVVELADNPRYPQFVLFQLSGDRCESLDGYEVGDEVQVEFSLRGREWTSPQGDVKYFNSLDVWTVTRTSAGQHSGDPGPPPDFGGPPLPNAPPPGPEDDIPF